MFVGVRVVISEVASSYGGGASGYGGGWWPSLPWGRGKREK